MNQRSISGDQCSPLSLEEKYGSGDTSVDDEVEKLIGKFTSAKA